MNIIKFLAIKKTSIVNTVKVVIVSILAIVALSCYSEIRNPGSPLGDKPENDVDSLLQKMTLEEKVSFLHGTGSSDFSVLESDPEGKAGVGYIPGVKRLGIPPLRLTDGPVGPRNPDAPTTAMPAPIVLAATFDTNLARKYGSVIGKEARSHDQDILLSPMVNIVRSPLAGRNFETFGEDPKLASELVAAEIGGIEDTGLMATVKHFVANNQETDRFTAVSSVGERVLREIYLPAFEASANAGVASFMCAYNRIAINHNNIRFCCETSELLNDILRDEWGYKGFVMSDWGAIVMEEYLTGRFQFSPDAIKYGLDMEQPLGRMFGDVLIKAVESGELDVAYVDRSVGRILFQMERFGMLDGTAPEREPIEKNANAHAQIAKEVALKGFVLLRNENNMLPLKERDVASLLVVGTTGAVPNMIGSGSSRVKALSRKSPLTALKELAGESANINYMQGSAEDGVAIPTTALSSDRDNSGLVRYVDDVKIQIDPNINFVASDLLPAGTKAVWKGLLTAPKSGDYELKIQTRNGGAGLKFNGGQFNPVSKRENQPQVNTGGFGSVDGMLETIDGLQNGSFRVTLEAGQSYPIEIIAEAGIDSFSSTRVVNPEEPMELRLAWTTPEQRQAELAATVDAAKKASAVVVFAYNLGTEGVDRPSLSLPNNQDDLITAIATVNPNTIVVLNTGDPVSMPWLNETAAVLQTWYPGQEGGDATAELLLGLANPSGRLPVSYPKTLADTPTAKPERFPGIKGVSRYDEGILVGYRWYDTNGIKPLFPFGFGLSYTSFEYSDEQLIPSENGYSLRFRVTNTGSVSGADVPQVYIGAPAQQPVLIAAKTLVGFDHVELNPGTSTVVTVNINKRDLSYWNIERHTWSLVPGSRTVYLGSSSADVKKVGIINATELSIKEHIFSRDSLAMK